MGFQRLKMQVASCVSGTQKERSAVVLGLENGGSVDCFQPSEQGLRVGALGWWKTGESGEGVGVWLRREGVGQGAWVSARGGVWLHWSLKLRRLVCTRQNETSVRVSRAKGTFHTVFAHPTLYSRCVQPPDLFNI